MTWTCCGSPAPGSCRSPRAARRPRSDTMLSSHWARWSAGIRHISTSWLERHRADCPGRARTSTCRSDSVCSRATPWRRPRRAPAASMATRAGTPRWLRSRWPISSIRSMARRRTETRARSRALQALYAWDMRGERDLERVAERVWDDLAVAADERRVAGVLIHVIAGRRAEIDRNLAEVTENWRMERLGAIERSVLRLAAAELAIGETPPRVVLQEAIRLAERYGSAQSARFVNGVLDALARKMGRL